MRHLQHRFFAGVLRYSTYLGLGLTVAACASLTAQERRAQSTAVAGRAGWVEQRWTTGSLVLAGFAPATLTESKTLRIYIEGDGSAWVNRSTPSSDPTPKDPLALRLALSDPSGQAVYLARPCQFIASSGCSASLWTHRRFAPEVVRASDQAISQLKERYHAQQLVLVGYSGGGALAALVAAQRKDVAQLITVAGNLDTKVWTETHRISPLSGSLNPADNWRELASIKQTHFRGEDDTIVPAQVAESYRQRFPETAKPDVVVLAGFDHHRGWVETWPSLLNKAGLPTAPRAAGQP